MHTHNTQWKSISQIDISFFYELFLPIFLFLFATVLAVCLRYLIKRSGKDTHSFIQQKIEIFLSRTAGTDRKKNGIYKEKFHFRYDEICGENLDGNSLMTCLAKDNFPTDISASSCILFGFHFSFLFILVHFALPSCFVTTGCAMNEHTFRFQILCEQKIIYF